MFLVLGLFEFDPRRRLTRRSTHPKVVSSMNQFLQNLNPEQREAASHTTGPLLILAGAGSGKTTVLISRTGQLIASGVQPSQILVLTFTNKAARELKERVAHRLGEKAKGIWAGTFHSFGLQIIRENHEFFGLPKYFGILDASDAKQILRELMKDTRMPEKAGFDLDHLHELIGRIRGGSSLPPDVDEVYGDMARALAPKYERRLKSLSSVDFESLLLGPISIFEQHAKILEKYQNRFQRIMVDEFQDTNSTQMRMLDLLASKYRNLAVVGDDDQSIYGWRGAEVKNILDFPKRYHPCTVVRLERNYRSHPSILEVANQVIKKNESRHDKVLKAEKNPERGRKPELFVYDNEEQEVDEVVSQIKYFVDAGYRHRDIAVLFRSNSQGGLLEGALRRHQIPYELTGGSRIVERTEAKDCLAYLKSALVPFEVALRRIVNTPSRGIGDTTLEALESFAKTHKTSFGKSLRLWEQAGINPRTGAKINEFLELHAQLVPHLLSVGDTRPVGEKWSEYFRKIGYRDHLLSQHKNPASADARWMVVEIVGRILEAFVSKGGLNDKTLRDFVDAMDLRDEPDDEPQNAVQLLTLHASKGLEFPVVIMMGIEEDILPHKRLGSDISEERRLFYVGVTRAQERLVLTRVRTRKKYGKLQPAVPSRFLLELEDNSLETYESGFRPISTNERQNMLAQFLAKYEKKPDPGKSI